MSMDKLGLAFGFLVIVVALAAAPMPLAVTLSDPIREVVIYPNVLFAVPLILLGALLLLYGVTAEKRSV